jgi:hypothetical protein
MKILLVIVLIFNATFSMAQNHESRCSLTIVKTFTQNTFGKNIGYYVDFKNNSGTSVDGIKWTARFYDNFGELKGKRDGQWQSGNFMSPIAPGDTGSDLEGVWVDDATKVFITINSVHYTNGTSCNGGSSKSKKK